MGSTFIIPENVNSPAFREAHLWRNDCAWGVVHVTEMGKTNSALKYCRVVGLQVIPVENSVRKVLFEVHRGERFLSFLLRSGKEEKFDLGT